jgi:hypothetical protein
MSLLYECFLREVLLESTEETMIHFCCHMDSDWVESSRRWCRRHVSYLRASTERVKTAATILALVFTIWDLFSGLEMGWRRSIA